MSRRDTTYLLALGLVGLIILWAWSRRPAPVRPQGRDVNLTKLLGTKVTPDGHVASQALPQHVLNPYDLGGQVQAWPHRIYANMSAGMSPQCSRVQSDGWAGWAVDPPSEKGLRDG